MKKIMVVFGTRPEAIKMCPLVNELKNRNRFDVVVCTTGQHKEMLQQVLDIFGVIPNYDLAIMKPNQTLFDITINILEKIRPILEKEIPDCVLVHGDTSTAFVTALACYYLNIKIGHVEAGLRTNNIYSPFPEEFNRQSISLISEFNFVPTKLSKENLLKEGKAEETIWITGNTVIDALKTTIRDDYKNIELDWARGSKLLFVTAHRRENIGQPMKNMFAAIKRIIQENEDVKVLYPMHPNPEIRKIAKEMLKDIDRIHLIEPVDAIECHNIMSRSYLVLTDSGGIQEEAPSLGVPVLVMRETTERPEGIEAGTLKLVGNDEKKIYDSCMELLNNEEVYLSMSKASNPYGDGRACVRICDVLEQNIN